jgi:FixJ family two-component response regulator/tetratricopeptide (TPR) repeat protein
LEESGLSRIKGKVVIIEDDATLCASLAEALKRDGYEAMVTSRPEEALEYLSANPVGALFVDCLLPTTSGVDFVQSIRKKYPVQVLDVILMSGLFTDSQFVKESLRQTQAIAFLKKPFDLKDALSLVKPTLLAVEPEEVPPRKALYLLMGKAKVSHREKRKAIEALDSIHGFDLPFIYSLLIETKANGHLNIVKDNGDVSGISFAQGKVIGVDIADRETQLGQLLIEAGYLMPDDLDTGLNINNQKRIGERLITANLLSPHAFTIALENQMKIRISRTITDTQVKVNFVATETELTEPYLDSEALTLFMHDWVASKMTDDWLKLHYMQWDKHQIGLAPGLNIPALISQFPLLKTCEEMFLLLQENPILAQATGDPRFGGDMGLKALHFLFIKGYLVLSATESVDNEGLRLGSLQKILAQVQGKNKFEILDMMSRLTGGSDADTDYVYNEFLRMLGPAPKDPQSPLYTVYNKLRDMAQQSFEFSKTGNREKMKEEIAQAEVEQKLKAVTQFEEAKQLLSKSQYSQALSMLQKVAQIDVQMEKLKLYLAWAKLAMLDQAKDRRQSLMDVESQLMQVPPEEKFDALYSFVLGLMYKAKGDNMGAKKSFEKAINLDANFIMARRELATLSGQTNVKKDVLNRDLKDLIGGLFKKKSS